MRIFLAFALFGVAFNAYCGEIHDAIRGKDAAKLEGLLKTNSALLKEPTTHGLRPLHMAVMCMPASKEVFDLLLAKGADVNVRDDSGCTPLHYAASIGNTEFVRILLEKKANPNVTNELGATPMWQAVGFHHREIVEMLLNNGGDPNIGSGPTGTPLMVAASSLTPLDDDLIAITKALLAKGADVNAKDSAGRTALHQAKHKVIVELILAQKVDLNAFDNDGWTPLHMARQAEKIEVAEALAKAGAKDWVKVVGGREIHQAAADGDAERVKALIKANPDSVNTRDKNNATPLFWAVAQGHLNIVELLINTKADVNARIGESVTPLSVAKDKAIIELLKANGAKE